MYVHGAVAEKNDRVAPPATSTAIASITDAASRERAARLVKNGAAVAAFVRSVWVLWIDPANHEAVETIYRIKGEKRTGRPMATALGAETFVELLDPDRIAPGVRKIFLDPEELKLRLSMLCLIRAPIKRSAVEMLPPIIVSHTPDGTAWLQNCVTTGPAPAVRLAESILGQGVAFPSVTSMNVSGLPEIVQQDEAEAFCRERRVPLALIDPGDKPLVRGSFPIIGVNKQGVRLIRNGHFPGYLFRYLLDGAEVELDGAALAKFPLVRTHSEEEASGTGATRLREEIIARLSGRN